YCYGSKKGLNYNSALQCYQFGSPQNSSAKHTLQHTLETSARSKQPLESIPCSAVSDSFCRLYLLTIGYATTLEEICNQCTTSLWQFELASSGSHCGMMKIGL
ncbi:hypothetical protein T07_8939, partial [Trichinella nelsoni]